MLLASRALRQGWPQTVVIMAVGQYAAARWVCVAGAAVYGGRARCGLIPGCAMAVQLLGSFLQELLSRAFSEGRVQGVCAYVDGLRIVVSGTADETSRDLCQTVWEGA